MEPRLSTSPTSPYRPIHTALLALATLSLVCLSQQAFGQSANALDGANTLAALQTTRLSVAEYFADGMTRRFTASRFELEATGRRSRSGPPFDFTPGANNEGTGVWFDGFGSFSRMSSDRNADDLQNYSAGGNLGFDMRGAQGAAYGLEHLRVGAALGYAYTHYKSDPGVADGHSSSFQGAVYAAYTLPRIYLGVMGRLAYADIQTTREITTAGVTQSAQGETSGLDASAYVELGGQLGDSERLAFRPLAAFHYTWVEQDAFSESHAGGDALSISEKTTSSLVTKLGARLSSLWRYDISMFGGGPAGEFGLEPEVHFTWNHEFGDRGRHVNVADGSGASSRLEGAESGRDYFMLGTGYTMRFHPTALLHLTYDARLQTNRVDHLARAGFELHW
jgi:uncharacterized protein with beta-barrel porin domain